MPAAWVYRVIAVSAAIWAAHVIVFVAIQYSSAVANGAPPSFALGVRHQSVFSALELPAYIAGALLGLRHGLAGTWAWRRVVECCGLVAAAMAADYFWTVLVLSPYTGLEPARLIANTPPLYWLLMPAFTLIAYLVGTQLTGLVRRGRAGMDGVTARRLVVRSARRRDFVAIDDLVVVSAQGNYVALVDRHGREILHRATMIEMGKKLADHGFVQIHRSHLVRPEEVVSTVQRKDRVVEVRLRSGQKLPVSTSGSAALEAQLGEYPLDAEPA